MNVYLSGLLWVTGAVVGAGGIAYLVRRFGRHEGRRDNNDPAGQVFTIVSGLHAVLVAFVLISLFDAVSAAYDGSYQEAESLVAASWAADSLEEPARTRVRELSASYADTVVQQEWPWMRDGARITDGRQVVGSGWAQLDQLRVAVAEATTTDDWQADRKVEAANQLLQVYQERQSRLTAAFDRGVVAVVWLVLIIGTGLSILLPTLFGGTRMTTHVVIVATLAGTLTLLLFSIYQLQNPFSGGARIEPDAFKWAIDRLG
jgi:hypothetical protein